MRVWVYRQCRVMRMTLQNAFSCQTFLWVLPSLTQTRTVSAGRTQRGRFYLSWKKTSSTMAGKSILRAFWCCEDRTPCNLKKKLHSWLQCLSCGVRRSYLLSSTSPLIFNSRWEGSDLSPPPAAAGLTEQAVRKQASSSFSSSVQMTSQTHLKDRKRIILWHHKKLWGALSNHAGVTWVSRFSTNLWSQRSVACCH